MYTCPLGASLDVDTINDVSLTDMLANQLLPSSTPPTADANNQISANDTRKRRRGGEDSAKASELEKTQPRYSDAQSAPSNVMENLMTFGDLTIPNNGVDHDILSRWILWAEQICHTLQQSLEQQRYAHLIPQHGHDIQLLLTLLYGQDTNENDTRYDLLCKQLQLSANIEDGQEENTAKRTQEMITTVLQDAKYQLFHVVIPFVEEHFEMPDFSL